jgi:hypothetical protein
MGKTTGLSPSRKNSITLHCNHPISQVNERYELMKKIGLVVVVAGGALISATAISNAQGTNPQSSGTGSGLCWDVSSNMILPDYRSTVGSAPPPNPSSTLESTLPLDTTVGSALSSHPGSTGSTFSTTGPDIARPAGIPEC